MFLDMGRRIERIQHQLRLINQLLVPVYPRLTPLLEAMLDIMDSSITYRYRYLMNVEIGPVLDLLLQDQSNPRSMVFQLLQVRMLKDRPLIFVGPMWRGLRSFIEQEIIGPGYASPEDIEVAFWVDTLDEALVVVERALSDFLRRNKVILPPPVAEEPEGEAVGT